MFPYLDRENTFYLVRGGIGGSHHRSQENKFVDHRSQEIKILYHTSQEISLSSHITGNKSLISRKTEIILANK